MQLDEIAALISPPLFNKSFLARVEMVWALPGQQVDVGKATNEKTISTFNQPNHQINNLSISQLFFSHSIGKGFILNIYSMNPPPQVNKWTLPMGGIIHLLGENVSQ